MQSSPGIILILTTVANPDQAKVLANGLVDAHLAACVTELPPAVSHFRWESAAVSTESEIVLLIKSHRAKLSAIETWFADHHPYEVPELLVFEASAAAEAYAQWLRQEINL
jgi:periplasmic divalent cation tolerance protein